MPSVYEIVTDKVLGLLEQGVVPWRQPWKAGEQRNITGRPYQGINALLLNCSGFSSCWWATFKQIKERGGKVKKGSKGEKVVFWKWRKVTITDEEGEEQIVEKPLLRYYTVFNLDQTEGLEPPEDDTLMDHDPIPEAEAIVKGMPSPPEIREGNEACLLYTSPSPRD